MSHQTWVLQMLGKVTDMELARQVGCSVSLLCRLRRQLGIPVYDAVRPYERLLGRIPDTVIAARAGCTAATVAARRKSKGIEPANQRRYHASIKLQRYVDALTDARES